MGGTEIRVLGAHAGNGDWQDRPGPEGLQGAQILVLDGPEAHWRLNMHSMIACRTGVRTTLR
jgi:hypothetical protein